MHVQDFVKVYEAKSDEELIQLAANLNSSLLRHDSPSKAKCLGVESASRNTPRNMREAGMTLAKESSEKYCKRASGVASAILWLKFFGPITVISGCSSKSLLRP